MKLFLAFYLIFMQTILQAVTPCEKLTGQIKFQLAVINPGDPVFADRIIKIIEDNPNVFNQSHNLRISDEVLGDHNNPVVITWVEGSAKPRVLGEVRNGIFVVRIIVARHWWAETLTEKQILSDPTPEISPEISVLHEEETAITLSSRTVPVTRKINGDEKTRLKKLHSRINEALAGTNIVVEPAKKRVQIISNSLIAMRKYLGLSKTNLAKAITEKYELASFSGVSQAITKSELHPSLNVYANLYSGNRNSAKLYIEYLCEMVIRRKSELHNLKMEENANQSGTPVSNLPFVQAEHDLWTGKSIDRYIRIVEEVARLHNATFLELIKNPIFNILAASPTQSYGALLKSAVDVGGYDLNESALIFGYPFVDGHSNTDLDTGLSKLNIAQFFADSKKSKSSMAYLDFKALQSLDSKPMGFDALLKRRLDDLDALIVKAETFNLFTQKQILDFAVLRRRTTPESLGPRMAFFLNVTKDLGPFRLNPSRIEQLMAESEILNITFANSIVASTRLTPLSDYQHRLFIDTMNIYFDKNFQKPISPTVPPKNWWESMSVEKRKELVYLEVQKIMDSHSLEPLTYSTGQLIKKLVDHRQHGHDEAALILGVLPAKGNILRVSRVADFESLVNNTQIPHQLAGYRIFRAISEFAKDPIGFDAMIKQRHDELNALLEKITLNDVAQNVHLEISKLKSLNTFADFPVKIKFISAFCAGSSIRMESEMRKREKNRLLSTGFMSEVSGLVIDGDQVSMRRPMSSLEHVLFVDTTLNLLDEMKRPKEGAGLGNP